MGLDIRPGFRLSANDEDITRTIRDRFVKLRLKDEAGLESDSLEITLADHLTGDPIELPPTGAELELWLGYDNAAQRMGLFVVDELELAGPPRKMTIRARAAPQEGTPAGKTALQGQKTRSWDAGTTLGAMVAKIADEHGLEPAVAASLADIELPHVDQVNESDINLLTRLAWDYDAMAKPAGGKLVLAKRGESRTTGSGQSQPLPSLELQPGDVTTWRVTIAKRTRWGSVVATWRDVDAAADQTVTAGEGSPVKRLKNPYPTEAAATAAAKSELDKGGRGERKLNLTLPGRTDLQAEGRVTLFRFGVGTDGQWLVTSVTHTVDASGYRCTVEGEQPKE